MLEPLLNASTFLIQTLFHMYLMILLLRLILPWVQADYYHPVSQFVITLTDPLVLPVRRCFPYVRHINVPTLIVLVAIDMLQWVLLWLLRYHQLPHLVGLFILTLGDLLGLAINLEFFIIIVWVIFSWVNPYHPVALLLARLSHPVLQPIRRYVPMVAGFDISPALGIVILQLLGILLVTPIKQFGLLNM